MVHNKSTINMFKGILPQFIAVLIGTLGAVYDGMHYGWTAPVLPELDSKFPHITVGESDRLWLKSIYLIGAITGLPLTVLSVNHIGRKGAILLSAVLALISWILIAVGNSIIYLYVARFIAGVSGDVGFVAAPMYIAEIADKKIRGFLAGIIYIMMLVGILIVYCVAPFTPYYVPSIIGSVLAVFQLTTFPFMPDSPYYLIYKGREVEAKEHLKRLRGTKDVDEELEEIRTAVYRQKSEKGRLTDLVIVDSNRKAVIIMITLNAAQHFSCISVMLMNLHEILTSANSIYMSSQTAGIVFAGIMFVAATIADLVIDKFGRKRLLITSSLLTGLCLLILAIYFTLKNQDIDMSGVSWIPIASVMVYAAGFKSGLGLIPIVMTAELFPAKLKAMGMTIADCAYVFFAWASVEVYQRLSRAVGHEVPFYIFSATSILTCIFVYFYVPETKGKTLEEIQFILKGEPCPTNKNSEKKDNEKPI